jgi:hypothetical protein
MDVWKASTEFLCHDIRVKLILLGKFCYQGAPARGASVKLFDENGRVQKRVIDAGRYRPLDNAL